MTPHLYENKVDVLDLKICECDMSLQTVESEGTKVAQERKKGKIEIVER